MPKGKIITSRRTREASSNGREISHITNDNKVEAPKPQARSASYQRVTYGGINGAYYISTTSRRSGSDGVTKRANKLTELLVKQRTGYLEGSMTRGTRTRKLGSDGQVDTMQTLHNLNEDELEGFEQAWKGNNDWHLHDAFDFPGNSGQLASWGGFPYPFRAHSSGVQRAQPSGGRPKKIVTINIE